MLWRKEHKIRPAAIPKDFFSSATKQLDPYLASFDFAPVGDELKKEWHAERVYRNGERYVRITLDVNPYDGKPWSNAILGGGGHEFPDSDWNSMALCQIAKNSGRQGAEYMVSGWTATQLFTAIRSDLELYGQPFLTGDLAEFLRLRAEQNAARESYKIYSPDASGKYSVSTEPESEALNERFSKPE
jgi:hypothetical protein